MPIPLLTSHASRAIRWRIVAAAGLASLAACGRDRDAGELAKGTYTGPDPIVVRVAEKGGKARAYRYPALDSAIWTSAQNVPAVSSLLAFDHENGVLAYADAQGYPGWIDLRLGGVVRPQSRKRLSSVATADGWAIYGVAGKNEITRVTPTGDWTISTGGRTIDRLLPQQNGALLVVLADDDETTHVMRLRPPDSRWLDSLTLQQPQHVARTDIGDRVYFALDQQLIAVSTGSLDQVAAASIEGGIVAIAPTPSGDRLYVVSERDVLDVYDRYSERVIASVALPGVVSDLRMDAAGRYVLAKAALGDTTWIISTASNRLMGGMAGAWRDDLPAVGVDGAVATVRGEDVLFIDPTTLQEVGRAEGGASDVWFFMLWNGFRPRAQGIDVPVEFSWRGRDSLIAAALGDTGRIAFVGRATNDSATRDATPAPSIDSVRPPPAPVRAAWTVSFAVVLTESRARELAATISVDGERAHVVVGRSGDTPVYRVVLGPYPTRADADRVGRASGRQYWVYDGVP